MPALIVAVPIPAVETWPPGLMIATFASEELHLANSVMSCVVPSLKLAVAASCSVVPNGMELLDAVTAIEVIVASYRYVGAANNSVQ